MNKTVLTCISVLVGFFVKKNKIFYYPFFPLYFKIQHLHTCKSLTQKAEPSTLTLITFTFKKSVFLIYKFSVYLSGNITFLGTSDQNLKSRWFFRGCNTNKKRFDRIGFSSHSSNWHFTVWWLIPGLKGRLMIRW